MKTGFLELPNGSQIKASSITAVLVSSSAVDRTPYVTVYFIGGQADAMWCKTEEEAATLARSLRDRIVEQGAPK